MYLDGAAFDTVALCMQEAAPATNWQMVPIVHFIPVANHEPDPANYECPLYVCIIFYYFVSSTFDFADTFSIAHFFCFFFFVTQVQDIDKEWCFEYDWNVHKLCTEC